MNQNTRSMNPNTHLGRLSGLVKIATTIKVVDQMPKTFEARFSALPTGFSHVQ